MKKGYFYGLIAAFILQSPCAAYVIWGHYEAQSKAGIFSFKPSRLIRAIIFAGQYVALNFAADSGKEIANDVCQTEDYQVVSGKLYARLKQNAQVWRRLILYRVIPPQGDDYVRINDGYCTGKTLHFSLPFKRYYANENEALPMEVAAREHPEQTFCRWLFIADAMRWSV
ncbi:hypothetical protein [Suttonella indologenes]|uniref:Uncharacterized protein n=1 Tax=Suttonella indologenes TaxID=13276 RepID=A0A380MGG8_9GAMM|nr:hypothetical protein [Suttonella indologenes]SUO89807.1 Uncharacterised protein [Suttonella indologenes]